MTTGVKVCDFVRVYVFDWHVLSALAVPLLFSALFPVYWMLICPKIWQKHPGKEGVRPRSCFPAMMHGFVKPTPFADLYDPRSWLIAYWLFASLVWIIFLGICFFRTRAGDARVKQSGMRDESSSFAWWEPLIMQPFSLAVATRTARSRQRTSGTKISTFPIPGQTCERNDRWSLWIYILWKLNKSG